ncbi:unnamed protein product [Amoebophrya sp. A25]|nr:unnamed protein product [Amoebophrya sp. A25]|eukprot:GSA25T00018226001.1
MKLFEVQKRQFASWRVWGVTRSTQKTLLQQHDAALMERDHGASGRQIVGVGGPHQGARPQRRMEYQSSDRMRGGQKSRGSSPGSPAILSGTTLSAPSSSPSSSPAWSASTSSTTTTTSSHHHLVQESRVRGQYIPTPAPGFSRPWLCSGGALSSSVGGKTFSDFQNFRRGCAGALRAACAAGDIEAFEELVHTVGSKVALREALDEKEPATGRSPLCLAAIRKQDWICRRLLQLGANGHARDASGRTAADYAKSSGCPRVANVFVLYNLLSLDPEREVTQLFGASFLEIDRLRLRKNLRWKSVMPQRLSNPHKCVDNAEAGIMGEKLIAHIKAPELIQTPQGYFPRIGREKFRRPVRSQQKRRTRPSYGTSRPNHYARR